MTKILKLVGVGVLLALAINLATYVPLPVAIVAVVIVSLGSFAYDGGKEIARRRAERAAAKA